MRLTIRRAADRGHQDHGWLNARHTFSFADYYDEAHMGFRSLRVINEDVLRPAVGFPTHPHRDMEIFSYIVGGAIEHQDSMGNGRVLRPGEIQLMSAGTGVTHSEVNPSRTEPLHLLQIWILPRVRGLRPSYTEWKPTAESERSENVVVISPDGRAGSATIHQDAVVHRLRLGDGKFTEHTLSEGRGLWLQVVKGSLVSAGQQLHAGDGASCEEAGSFTFTSKGDSEALLFDLGA